MTDRLYEAGLIVGHLSRALLDGTRDLGLIPGLIKRIIQDDMWQEYCDPKSGRRYGPFPSFESFIEMPARNGGLGMTVRELLGLCVNDIAARDAIDRACQRSDNPGRRTDLVDNVNKVLRPDGNSEAAALRRLRKDRPDLLERVLSGELTAHAAARQAGFRRQQQSVRMDDPDSAARTLKKFMSPEVRQELARLLRD